eukprot:250285-Pyramimonas_sp.AAC.1
MPILSKVPWLAERPLRGWLILNSGGNYGSSSRSGLPPAGGCPRVARFGDSVDWDHVVLNNVADELADLRALECQ